MTEQPDLTRREIVTAGVARRTPSFASIAST